MIIEKKMNENKLSKNKSIDRLESLSFQFSELYERVLQDRQQLNQEREAFKLISESANKVSKASENSDELLKTFHDKFKHLVNSALIEINESLKTTLDSFLEKAVPEEQQINNEKLIANIHKSERRFTWKIIGLTFLSSLVINILIVWLLFPKSQLTLSKEQLDYLKDGQMLAQIWPQLTASEKNHLKYIANK